MATASARMMISKKLLLKEYDEHTTIKRQQMSTGDENSQPEGEGRRLSSEMVMVITRATRNETKTAQEKLL
eukprot:CAMPEP_0206131682 /NCGR_PEP_ID=MMETSP1472-20131121/46173_1 /ASSEMBLY_ACC=CAM_ASM_001108 /TAXON_ID=41880 /ORGANISM="Pycnococcus provasolii, Strain RCC251" /LENGTH=70 /DNA_ID=CAMNT_0053523135 /DNA_START=242 /DNA_END=454 /DNA_ORIENTATION=+